MATAVKMRQIVRDIEDLDYTDKLDILSRIAIMLKKTEAKKSYSITDLKGLGKDIWQKHDVNAYIIKERESWD